MKRLVLILSFILIFITGSVNAAVDNYLNEVVLEGTADGYNIVLRSDFPIKVKKYIPNNNQIVLTMKSACSSKRINTIYKNTNAADNIIVENNSKDVLKVYINAKSIANANIILSMPNSAPISIADKFAKAKILLAVCITAFILLSLYYLKSQNRRIAKKITMREREIAFYKANMPSINFRTAQKAYADYPFIPVNSAEPKTLRQYQNQMHS